MSPSVSIELHGSNEDVALLKLIANRLADSTSGEFDAAEFQEALHTVPLGQKEFPTWRTIVS